MQIRIVYILVVRTLEILSRDSVMNYVVDICLECGTETRLDDRVVYYQFFRFLSDLSKILSRSSVITCVVYPQLTFHTNFAGCSIYGRYSSEVLTNKKHKTQTYRYHWK